MFKARAILPLKRDKIARALHIPGYRDHIRNGPSGYEQPEPPSNRHEFIPVDTK